MARKFTGALGQKISKRRIGLLVSDSERDEKIAEWVADDFRKLDLLADHYGLPHGDYCQLALTLAREFVPGFQQQNPKQPDLWTEFVQALLIVEIERKVVKGSRDRGVSWACKTLLKSEPWKSALRESREESAFGDPSAARQATMRQAYYAAKKNKNACKLAAVSHHAFKLYELEGRPDDWQSFVDDCVRNPKSP